MVLISNKPNIKGIAKVTEDVTYRTGLIGRDLRLFMGLIATRIFGVSLGVILAFVLVAIPALWRIYVGG